MITNLVKEDENLQIAAGVDDFTDFSNAYPVFTQLDTCDVHVDVVIDFTNAEATDRLLAYCVAKKLPIVLYTTGLSPEQLDNVKAASN